MNPEEKFIKTIQCDNADTPIFCPAIYDYKANFSITPVNLFGQNKKELLSAIEEEISLLQPEVVTCGYDIYNIEAQALGAKVQREKKGVFPDISIPLIEDLNKVKDLPKFEVTAGRVSLFRDATKYLTKKYQNTVYVRGAVSGPFSLAGSIYKKDQLILDCILNPQGVAELMDYCTDVIISHIRSYLDESLDVVVFDSLASPPLISPDIYRDLIFPFHQKIFDFIKRSSVRIRPLIMGGNTLPIIDHLAKTGANQLLLDYSIPVEDIDAIVDRYNLAFRLNIDPALVAQDNSALIVDRLKHIFSYLGHRANLLIGTGILLKNTPLKNIQFLRNFIRDHYWDIMK